MFPGKKRGPYKKYSRTNDGSVQYPKTTAWRKRRQKGRSSIMEQQLICNGAGQDDQESLSPRILEDSTSARSISPELEIRPDDLEIEDEANFDQGAEKFFFNLKLVTFMREYSEYRNFKVDYSASEIAFMLITLSISQNLTLNTTWRLFKMINGVSIQRVVRCVRF